MNKAFTREDDAPEDDFEGEEENPIPPGSKNYLTPAGWQRMREEVKWLVNVERPDVTLGRSVVTSHCSSSRRRRHPPGVR